MFDQSKEKEKPKMFQSLTNLSKPDTSYKKDSKFLPGFKTGMIFINELTY